VNSIKPAADSCLDGIGQVTVAVKGLGFISHWLLPREGLLQAELRLFGLVGLHLHCEEAEGVP